MKFTTLIPLRLNDGTEVPTETLDRNANEFIFQFGGCSNEVRCFAFFGQCNSKPVYPSAFQEYKSLAFSRPTLDILTILLTIPSLYACCSCRNSVTEYCDVCSHPSPYASMLRRHGQCCDAFFVAGFARIQSVCLRDFARDLIATEEVSRKDAKAQGFL